MDHIYKLVVISIKRNKQQNKFNRKVFDYLAVVWRILPSFDCSSTLSECSTDSVKKLKIKIIQLEWKRNLTETFQLVQFLEL